MHVSHTHGSHYLNYFKNKINKNLLCGFNYTGPVITCLKTVKLKETEKNSKENYNLFQTTT